MLHLQNPELPLGGKNNSSLGGDGAGMRVKSRVQEGQNYVEHPPQVTNSFEDLAIASAGEERKKEDEGEQKWRREVNSQT